MVFKIALSFSVCFLLCQHFTLNYAGVTNEEDGNMFNELLTSYDKRIRPNELESPVIVNVTAFILSVEDLDQEKHEFTTTLYLRQYWKDIRLMHSSSDSELSTISLDKEEEKKIWKPDTFIVSGKSVKEFDSFLKISENGDIVRSAKVTITASCKMTFGYFPHDSHTCRLDFESYGYTDKEVVYAWGRGKDSLLAEEGASPPNFLLAAFNTKHSLELTGNYSKLSLEMYMVRKTQRSLPNLYFPAMAITMTSFFTLWSGSRQSRIQISVLCLLGMIFLMGITYPNLPNVSFQTAIEHYYFLCANLILNVVFVNFILYSFLSPRQSYRRGSQNEMKQIQRNGIQDDIEKHQVDKNYEVPPYASTKFQKIMLVQCKKSKWHLPIGFAIFNVIYIIVIIIVTRGYPEGFTLFENQH